MIFIHLTEVELLEIFKLQCSKMNNAVMVQFKVDRIAVISLQSLVPNEGCALRILRDTKRSRKLCATQKKEPNRALTAF